MSSEPENSQRIIKSNNKKSEVATKSNQQKVSISRIESAQISKTQKSGALADNELNAHTSKRFNLSQQIQSNVRSGQSHSVYDIETQSDAEYDKNGPSKKTQPVKNGRYGPRGPYKKKLKATAQIKEFEADENASLNNER